MAAPSVWSSNAWGFGDGPLTPADVNWRNFERDMRESEAAVAASVWEPGAGEIRPVHDTWSRPRSEDLMIFEEEFRR